MSAEAEKGLQPQMLMAGINNSQTNAKKGGLGLRATPNLPLKDFIRPTGKIQVSHSASTAPAANSTSNSHSTWISKYRLGIYDLGRLEIQCTIKKDVEIDAPTNYKVHLQPADFL